MEVLVLIAIVGIGIAIAGWWFGEQRRKEFAAVAASLGLSYESQDPFGLAELPFALFRRGDAQGSENVLYGDADGNPVKVFDFWYREDSVDSKGHVSHSYSRFSCAVTEIAALCPHLTLERETLIGRVADLVGFRDVEFESGEFNRAFQVGCSDRRFATALIDARMMEWLLEAGRFSYEVSDGYVLCATGRRRPRELAALLEGLLGFVEHIPPVVASLYPAGAEREG